MQAVVKKVVYSFRYRLGLGQVGREVFHIVLILFCKNLRRYCWIVFFVIDPCPVVPKNTEAYRSTVPAGQVKRVHWGFCDELPVVRWRQCTVCMCALTDTSLHASGGVHKNASGRTHLSDGPSRFHELEYSGALAASWFITWKSPMRVGLSCHPARAQAVLSFPSGDTWRSRDFQLCLTGFVQCIER